MTAIVVKNGVLAADTLMTVNRGSKERTTTKIVVPERGELKGKPILAMFGAGNVDIVKGIMSRYEDHLWRTHRGEHRHVRDTIRKNPLWTTERCFLKWFNASVREIFNTTSGTVWVINRVQTTKTGLFVLGVQIDIVANQDVRVNDVRFKTIFDGSGARLCRRVDDELKPYLKEGEELTAQELTWLATRLMRHCGGVVEYVDLQAEAPKIEMYEPTLTRKKRLASLLRTYLLTDVDVNAVEEES